jgi:hypothetical protein
MWDTLYDILPLENVAFLNALQDDEDLYEHLIGAKSQMYSTCLKR